MEAEPGVMGEQQEVPSESTRNGVRVVVSTVPLDQLYDHLFRSKGQLLAPPPKPTASETEHGAQRSLLEQGLPINGPDEDRSLRDRR